MDKPIASVPPLSLVDSTGTKKQAGILTQYRHPFSLPNKFSDIFEWTPLYSGGTAWDFHPTSLFTEATKTVLRHLIFSSIQFFCQAL